MAAFLVLGASCRLFQGLTGSEPPRPFNHEAHLQRGLDCQTCHEGAKKSEKAGMPAKELCMGCHEGLDGDPKKPRVQTVAWFLDAKGEPEWSAFTRQSEEIRFSHAAHAAKKIGCDVCHAGIEEDEGLRTGLLQRMDSCVACHAKEALAKNECSTCHREAARDRAPSSHGRLWKQRHGGCSREGRSVSTANDCSMCHRDDECVTCHQTEPPASHTAYWRLRGHGVASSIDRTSCRTCHQSDMCDRCHHETAPVSHGAGWNAPSNRHCTNCHVPLSTSDGCFVCHRSTPGHDTAPVKPAWHTSAMICRTCHAASLVHIDNGDNCNVCHP